MTGPVPEGWDSPEAITFTAWSAGVAGGREARAAVTALDLVRVGHCDCCGQAASIRDLTEATGHPRTWDLVCAERTPCIRRAAKASWEAEQARIAARIAAAKRRAA